MGTRGVLIAQQSGAWPTSSVDAGRFIPGFKVSVSDGNVASSAFIAGFAHILAKPERSEDLRDAVRFGLATMAVSLTRAGGQSSLASEKETLEFLASSSGSTSCAANKQNEKLQALTTHASSIRKRIIRMLFAARSGHPGGSLSVVELLTALYFDVMVYNPKDPNWLHRDSLVLSKGHAAPALYSTLIEAGFLDPSLETQLRKLGSPLQGHPDLKKCAGVDMSTGSLGQGLSVANGMALASRHNNGGYRVYVILGDGEVEEGQVWEAAMTSAHYGLDNICAVVDYNALQIDGSISKVKSPIEPLADKWTAFGWNVVNVDGHDLGDLCEAFGRAREVKGKPTMIVAHTIKGHGVSFMEGVIEYHGSTLSEGEVKRALRELEVE
jgi:transketolase